MRRYEKRHRLLAIGLAALAGFVDALGFLKLGGLFAGALIAAFVGGVMAGETVGRLAGRRRKQAVLAFVLVALAIASATATRSDDLVLAPLLMAVAMGSANAVFQRDGEVSVGVTYMTGTLVKIGQHLTTAFAGGPRFGWVPYLLLWLGLIAGATAGAAMFPILDLKALWIAVALAALLFVGAATLRTSHDE